MEVSTRQKALLLGIVKILVSDHTCSDLGSSPLLRRVHDGMVNIGRTLRNDKKVIAARVLDSELSRTSILVFCETLNTVNVGSVNKQEICQQIRKFLNSQEECTCPPVEVESSSDETEVW